MEVVFICLVFLEGGGGLYSRNSNLHTVTLFNNCLDVDLSIVTQESINVQTFDLGNQNSCRDENRNDIPLVKTFHDFDITIPLIYVDEQQYKVDLARYHLSDESGWYWHVSNIVPIDSSSIQTKSPPVEFNIETSTLTLTNIYLGADIIEATLHSYTNPSDPNGIYFQYIPE